MSYDEQLASRARKALRGRGDFAERKMFGGVCFMVDGAMCLGVLKSDLIVRVGAAQQVEALAQPHTRVFDLSGRPAKGMVYVSPEGTATEAALVAWVRRAVAAAREAPPKVAARRAARVGKR